MDVNTRRYNSLVDDIKCFPVLTAIHQKIIEYVLVLNATQKIKPRGYMQSSKLINIIFS